MNGFEELTALLQSWVGGAGMVAQAHPRGDTDLVEIEVKYRDDVEVPEGMRMDVLHSWFDEELVGQPIDHALASHLLHFMVGSACPGQDMVYQHDYRAFVSIFVDRLAALRVPSIIEQPHVVLTEWNVIKTRELFLAGTVAESGQRRTTSGIDGFDLQNMTVTTRSGRLYRLQGKPVRDARIESSNHWPMLREAGLISSWI